MADDVTKKDLQSLQGYCNKKIADTEKSLLARIDEVEKHLVDSLNKAVEVANKNDSGFKDVLNAHKDILDEHKGIINKLSPAVNKHETVINQHAAAIKALELD